MFVFANCRTQILTGKKLRAKGTPRPVPFCLKKNRTVPFDGKFSPVIPYKWKAPEETYIGWKSRMEKPIAFDFTPELPRFPIKLESAINFKLALVPVAPAENRKPTEY